MSTDSQTDTPESRSPDSRREWSTRAFLGFLGVISCLYAAMLIYHIAKPVGTVADDASLLEQCRQICLRYGLITTGNVRKDAEAYLEAAQSKKMTEGLAVILADSRFTPVMTMPHALLNQQVPDFTLPDVQGQEHRLRQSGTRRHKVVVFYLGYACSHCVAQLLALDKDLHDFRELETDIVAISADSSEHTAEKYREYGEFQFPVLADVDSAVSRAWGVYSPATEEKSEFVNHGTFIVDAEGRLIWAAQGKEPFLDNKTLVHVIAKSQGRLPASPAVAKNGTPVDVSVRNEFCRLTQALAGCSTSASGRTPFRRVIPYWQDLTPDVFCLRTCESGDPSGSAVSSSWWQSIPFNPMEQHTCALSVPVF